MGGGRCHFQDCTQKNDGIIHMFRYPVFDKVRCHRWLVASGRMDLLKLKVSQVRNKQICQHHFQDFDFMNALKNSLKPSAIPVLPGPFCMGEINQDPDDFPLMQDQIENEVLLPKDIKPESLNSKLYEYLITSEMEGLTSAIMKPETQKVSVSSYDYLNTSKLGPMKNQIVIIENPVGPNKRKKNKATPALNYRKIQPPKKLEAPKIVAPKSIDVQEIVEEFEENRHVKILSQKTVSPSNLIQQTPLKLAELKRINPESHVIGIKNENSLLKDNFQEKCSIDLVPLNEKENLLLNKDTQISDNIPVPAVSPKQDNNMPNTVDQNPPNSEEAKVPEPEPQVKSVINTAVIQEKRTFNRRLKDIIRESIDMADSRTPKEEPKTFTTPTKEPKVVKVKSVKDTSNVEPMIALAQLQDKIKNMGALLLYRIDANTKEVNELKKLLMEKTKADKEIEKEVKKVEDHEDRKRRLFTEISEYLSKESKSALYEKLFISKYPKRTRR